MAAFAPIELAEICRRWHQATVANNMLQWRSLSHLLAAEASMCLSDGWPGHADEAAALSNLAHQRALDLQPQDEMEPA